MEVAIKFDSADVVQFLIEIEPWIDLEHPYELALSHGNLDALETFKKHSPHIAGTYLPSGKLQITFILTKGLANWAKKSRAIEFLVTHAPADVNATGSDGLAAVHVAR